jgi:DNA-binding XRE family transcriptional regulator
MSNWTYAEDIEEPTCGHCRSASNNRFCIHNHDTWKCGRSASSNRCRECIRETDRRRDRRNHPEYVNTRMNPEPIPNLRKVRYNLGLTQEELAVYCKISTAHVSRLERSDNTASERVRIQILAGVKRAQKEKAEEIKARDRRRLQRIAG